MKKDGLSIEAIRKYTGLSKEEILKLLLRLLLSIQN